jgi:hypothetical protein
VSAGSPDRIEYLQQTHGGGIITALVDRGHGAVDLLIALWQRENRSLPDAQHYDDCSGPVTICGAPMAVPRIH